MLVMIPFESGMIYGSNTEDLCLGFSYGIIQLSPANHCFPDISWEIPLSSDGSQHCVVSTSDRWDVKKIGIEWGEAASSPTLANGICVAVGSRRGVSPRNDPRGSNR